jgi:hypothetical protein
MTFFFSKLKGRQTEATPCLDQFMTFEGSDKSVCTFTNTGCLLLLLSSISPAHHKFMLLYGSDQQLSVHCIICLFVFLALQPIVFVFSQPSSGL